MWRRGYAGAVIVVGVMLGFALGCPAHADGGPCDAPAGPAQYPDKFDWSGGSYLLGDLQGVRNKATEAGVTLCSQYNLYAYDNARGGLKRGVDAQGQLFSWIDIDLGKFSRVDALSDTFAHAGYYSLQGRSITPREVGSFSSVSFFEALSTNRLGTAWIERRFLDGKLSLRAGQLGMDDEFFLAPSGSAFLNSTFGFPSWTGTVLPGGGAAYSLQGPGTRVKYSPTDSVTLMAGAFTGDPAGRSNAVPQLANRYGTTFNLNGGTLWIGEAAYSTAYANSGVALPGTYKIGAWFETRHDFNALRFDTIGLSLADPASSGRPKRYGNDFGVYGIVDQTLFSGEKDGVHKLSGFLRLGASPSDRNLVDLYLDGGLTFTGPIPGRPTDLVGIGMAYDRISNAARSRDRDARAFAALASTPALGASQLAPVRDQEVMIEALYTIIITPWCTLDLDVQHVFHPSGHVLATSGPNIGKVVKDATLIGLNTQIKF